MTLLHVSDVHCNQRVTKFTTRYVYITTLSVCVCIWYTYILNWSICVVYNYRCAQWKKGVHVHYWTLSKAIFSFRYLWLWIREMCKYIYVNIYIDICMYIYTYIFIYIYIYKCTYINTNKCVCNICAHGYMCIYIYI